MEKLNIKSLEDLLYFDVDAEVFNMSSKLDCIKFDTIDDDDINTYKWDHFDLIDPLRNIPNCVITQLSDTTLHLTYCVSKNILDTNKEYITAKIKYIGDSYYMIELSTLSAFITTFRIDQKHDIISFFVQLSNFFDGCDDIILQYMRSELIKLCNDEKTTIEYLIGQNIDRIYRYITGCIYLDFIEFISK